MHNFERRIRSFSIDISLSTILFFLLLTLINTFEIESNQIKLIIAASIAYFGVLVVPNLFNKGQTFGKRNQKMMVVNIHTEKAPSMMIVVLREIIKGILMIGSYGVYLVVCGIMVNARKDGRVIHDLIFKTKVICLTTYVSDKEQGYVLGQTETAKKHMKGSNYE